MDETGRVFWRPVQVPASKDKIELDQQSTGINRSTSMLPVY